MKHYLALGFETRGVTKKTIQTRYEELMADESLDEKRRNAIQKAYTVLSNQTLRDGYDGCIVAYNRIKERKTLSQIVLTAYMNRNENYFIFLLEDILDDSFSEDRLYEDFYLIDPPPEEEEVEDKEQNWSEMILDADCSSVIKIKVLQGLDLFRPDLDRVSSCLECLRDDILSPLKDVMPTLGLDLPLPSQQLFEAWLRADNPNNPDDKKSLMDCFNILISMQLKPSFAVFKSTLESNPMKVEHLRVLVKYEEKHPFLTNENVSDLLTLGLLLGNSSELRNIFCILASNNLRGITKPILELAARSLEGNGRDLLYAVANGLSDYKGSRDLLTQIQEWLEAVNIEEQKVTIRDIFAKIKTHLTRAINNKPLVKKEIKYVLPGGLPPVTIVASAPASAQSVPFRLPPIKSAPDTLTLGLAPICLPSPVAYLRPNPFFIPAPAPLVPKPAAHRQEATPTAQPVRKKTKSNAAAPKRRRNPNEPVKFEIKEKDSFGPGNMPIIKRRRRKSQSEEAPTPIPAAAQGQQPIAQLRR